MAKNVIVTTTNDATTQHLRKVNVLAAAVAGTSLPTWASATESPNRNTFETVVSVTPTLIGAKTVVIPAGGGGGETPAYGNAGGTGDRTALITITGTMTAGGGVATALVDGTLGDSYFFTAGQNAKTLIFDFGVGASKVINEFKWYQSAVVGHGTAQSFAGSNDNSSYTTFVDSFSLGASTAQTVPVTNATGYRYYRLSFPGATSASPYIREIEFKIGSA